MNDTATLGHNNPPNDAETLKAALAENNYNLLEHAANLCNAANRIPAEITEAETAGKAADFIKQVTGAKKKLEALRVSEKEPYLTLGRVVDGFFKGVIDPLDIATKKALKPLDAYNIRIAAEERRRREEEARIAREKQAEEMRVAAALEKAKFTEAANQVLDQAAASEAVAQTLQKEAEAKPAHLGHVRGESGARAALVTRWVGEVTDLAAIDLETLRHHLGPDAIQKALNSYVRAGGRELRGAKIFEESTTQVRG